MFCRNRITYGGCLQIKEFIMNLFIIIIHYPTSIFDLFSPQEILYLIVVLFHSIMVVTGEGDSREMEETVHRVRLKGFEAWNNILILRVCSE